MADDEAVPLPKSSSDGGVLLLAENVSEKLKILNYDVAYCYRKGILPFSRTFFTEPALNANQQWTVLVSLMTWLMRQLGQELGVDKFDDPNASANKMLLALRTEGLDADFPVARLKQAYGDAVLRSLDFLADKALKKRGFKFGAPEHPPSDGVEVAQVDAAADLGRDDIADEAPETDDEDDAMFADAASAAHHRGSVNVLRPSSGTSAASQGAASDGSAYTDGDANAVSRAVLRPDATTAFQEAWRAEVDRVAPRLKRAAAATAAATAAGAYEWRAHLEQTQAHEKAMAELLPGCREHLGRIDTDLTQALERISAREAALGGAFEHLSRDFRAAQERLRAATAQHETGAAAVEALADELATVSEQLEALQESMDSKGNAMVDTSPLQKIRRALARFKTDVKQMELRIGVLSHALLQHGLRAAQEAREAKRGNGAGAGHIDAVDPAMLSPGDEDDASPRSAMSPAMF